MTRTRRQQSLTARRAELESERSLSVFWLEQLQDTVSKTGAFTAFCRAQHVQKLNIIMASILRDLCNNDSGIATQNLDFQLLPKYSLVPLGSTLSIGKRSRGQKTRTYLALFLAMFQLTRTRLPLRTLFVMLDEVMDALDGDGIEALQRWLTRYAADPGVRAFLLTHRETSLSGNVLEVVRSPTGRTVYHSKSD